MVQMFRLWSGVSRERTYRLFRESKHPRKIRAATERVRPIIVLLILTLGQGSREWTDAPMGVIRPKLTYRMINRSEKQMIRLTGNVTRFTRRLERLFRSDNRTYRKSKAIVSKTNVTDLVST